MFVSLQDAYREAESPTGSHFLKILRWCPPDGISDLTRRGTKELLHPRVLPARKQQEAAHCMTGGCSES